MVVGHSELVNHYDLHTNRHTACTENGLMLPFSSRLTVSNVKMVNFDKSGCVAFGEFPFNVDFFLIDVLSKSVKNYMHIL